MRWGAPQGHTHPRGSGWTPGAPAGSGDGRGAAWCWCGEASRRRRGETLRERKDTQLRQSSPGTRDSRRVDIPREKGPDPRVPLSPTPHKAVQPLSVSPPSLTQGCRPGLRPHSAPSRGPCHESTAADPGEPSRTEPRGRRRRRKEPGPLGRHLGSQGSPPWPSRRADLRSSGRLAARAGSAPAGRPPQTWPARRSPWLPSAE